MRSRAATLLLIALVLSLGATGAAAEPPQVALETSKGRIVLELDADKAPATVASFLETVRAGFYDGTLFHRVRKDFMVQGGGFDETGKLKPTDKLLRNEADNGLSNLRGTVAMARKGDPHSASVQFFINTVDNRYLDFRSRDVRGWGYAVFGRVVEGMDVVDAIENTAVRRGTISEAVPLEPVVIRKASVVPPPAEG